MKYIATEEAIVKLNEYGMNEIDVVKEHKSLYDFEHDKIDIGDVVMNWKNKNLIITPLGKNTTMIFVYGQNIDKSYEDLPEIVYKNKWVKIK